MFGVLKKTPIFASQLSGTIAQSVEQRTENPCVPGSIPGGTTEASYLGSSLFLCYYVGI